MIQMREVGQVDTKRTDPGLLTAREHALPKKKSIKDKKKGKGGSSLPILVSDAVEKRAFAE